MGQYISSYFHNPGVFIGWGLLTMVFFIFYVGTLGGYGTKEDGRVAAIFFLSSLFFGWALLPILSIAMVLFVFYVLYRAIKTVFRNGN
jgi:hypothetical protein